MKLQKIVVGVDFSDASLAAAHWVAMHLAPEAELLLVHAFTVAEPPALIRARHTQLTDLVANATRGALDRLGEVADAIGRERSGPPVRVEARVGSSADVLAEAARTMPADAIVVGKHGQHPAPWGWLGSTAEAVLRTSSAPVLLATGMRDAKPRHLLVALDDGDVTPWVILSTRCLSRMFDADVHAVHVASLPPAPAVVGAGGFNGGYALDEVVLTEAAKAEAEQWRERLIRGGCDESVTQVEAVYGEPAYTIVEHAERYEADLVVMGNRRKGGRRPLTMLGSTVRGVLRHASCPVLVVSEPEDELEEPLQTVAARASAPSMTGIDVRW